jgi:hypothetical protein
MRLAMTLVNPTRWPAVGSSRRLIPVVAVLALLGCERHRPEPAGAASDASASAFSAAENDGGEAYTFPIPKEGVEAMLNPSHLPAYDGPSGSVEGTVYVTGPLAPDVRLDAHACPAAIDTYGKLFRSGVAAQPEDPRPLADAVVVVVGYVGYYVPEHNEAVRVTIGANCGYPSRSIAMTYGQRLEIVNESAVPFAPAIEREFSPAVMMAPPHAAGDPIRIYPRRAEYSAMTDRMAPFVREDLYVFRHPLHAVTDLKGHYRIDGVPVGKLTVGIRHPGVGAEAQEPVEVTANVVKRVDATLTYAPKRPVVPGSAIP